MLHHRAIYHLWRFLNSASLSHLLLTKYVSDFNEFRDERACKHGVNYASTIFKVDGNGYPYLGVIHYGGYIENKSLFSVHCAIIFTSLATNLPVISTALSGVRVPSNGVAWLTTKAMPDLLKSNPLLAFSCENEIVIKNGAVVINPVDWAIQDMSQALFAWITSGILGADVGSSKLAVRHFISK